MGLVGFQSAMVWTTMAPLDSSGRPAEQPLRWMAWRVTLLAIGARLEPTARPVTPTTTTSTYLLDPRIHPRSFPFDSSDLHSPALISHRTTWNYYLPWDRCCSDTDLEPHDLFYGSDDESDLRICKIGMKGILIEQQARVRPDFSYKDAVLSPSATIPAPLLPPRHNRLSTSRLPLLPPLSLHNPSLIGRCFRCFERGHVANGCREPRRCLRCTRFGHSASVCERHRKPSSPAVTRRTPVVRSLPFRRNMDNPRRPSTSALRRLSVEPGPSNSRPSAATVFLPCPPSPAAPLQPLSACVARVEIPITYPQDSVEILVCGLASRFGGSSTAYKVASFLPETRAIFFPSWHVRESAVGRSPLRFNDLDFHFSDWVEAGEGDSGYLRHKAWIRLHNWPILTWNVEDVKAAVSGFGELWEVDTHSEQHSNVSYFRVLIRCHHANSIPEALDLMVEDRCFFVPIEIESVEDARPILLGEGLDDHLGLVSLVEQERFIRQTGFYSIPAYRSCDPPPAARQEAPRRRRAPLQTSRPTVAVHPGARGSDLPRDPSPHALVGQGGCPSQPLGRLDAGRESGSPLFMDWPGLPSSQALPNRRFGDRVEVDGGRLSPDALLPGLTRPSEPTVDPVLESTVLVDPEPSFSPSISRVANGPPIPTPAWPDPEPSKLPNCSEPSFSPSNSKVANEPPLPTLDRPDPDSCNLPNCSEPRISPSNSQAAVGLSESAPRRPDALPPSRLASALGPCLHVTPSDSEPRLLPLRRPASLAHKSGKLLFSRRSVRLAAKNIDNHKSSLQRAQDIMSKKAKLLKTSRPSTSAAASDPHLDSFRPLVGKSGGSSASMEAPAPQDRDKLIPLTLEDIQIIKTHNIIRGVGRARDFNVLLSIQDKNGPTTNINDILSFRETVQESGLIDIPIANKSFTWSNGRVTPTLERLDRVFISNAWTLVFPRSALRALPRPRSDHTPLVLSSYTFIPSANLFRFEAFWLRHPALRSVVAAAWRSVLHDTNPVNLILRKIESVQSALRSWSADISLASREQGKRCLLWIEWLDKAEEYRPLTTPEYILRPKLKTRYEDICLQEEIKWKQRSRVQWLKVGDANTKFFHQQASARRSKNFISRLSTGSSTFTSPDQIAGHLLSFFRNQLGVQLNPSVDINLHAIYADQQIDLSSLHALFTVSEVKTAVFSSAPEKAPGPDGLPMLFYQHFWNLIKDDIMGMFNNFYNGLANLTGANTGWLCLVPKKNEALSANDFRPISLIHSVAKLISKVLASRLQNVLGELINSYQAAFLKGRHISDNFNCAHILIHHLYTTKQRAALLKIDFERAFDQVDWSFLLDLLQARGFSQRWISWIRSFLHSASTSVILNGTPGKSFPCRRGLRQGDPLSPLLFILCVDVLYRLIQIAVIERLLPDVGIGNARLHTLQFADDLIIFFDGSTRSAAIVKLILDKFAGCSGLKINYSKSSVTPINMPDAQASSLQEEKTTLTLMPMPTSGLIGLLVFLGGALAGALVRVARQAREELHGCSGNSGSGRNRTSDNGIRNER
uniref:Reverse transcriptase domain-containing protein n=1 Tax=Ananas comosus var. bracteatus TaxID=296719 RepID=A0A6V7PFW9_ANACO|nr:unnamed protein product [Ananas comosus var. bracteatus]